MITGRLAKLLVGGQEIDTVGLTTEPPTVKRKPFIILPGGQIYIPPDPGEMKKLPKPPPPEIPYQIPGRRCLYCALAVDGVAGPTVGWNITDRRGMWNVSRFVCRCQPTVYVCPQCRDSQPHPVCPQCGEGAEYT